MKDIADYQLVIVGSGIQIHNWTGEAEKFLKDFQKELRRKKLALFVCCGSAQPLTEKEDEKLRHLKKQEESILRKKPPNMA